MSSRKRSRLNPAFEKSTTSPPATQQSQRGIVASSSKSTSSSTLPGNRGQGMSPPIVRSSSRLSSLLPSSSSKSTQSANQVHKTRSWYGSWSGKSQASTQLATENISGGTLRPDSVPDFSRWDTKKSSGASTDSDTQSIGAPTSGEVGATSTKTTNPASSANAPAVQQGRTSQGTPKADPKDNERKADNETVEDGQQTEQTPTVQPPGTTSSGWLGWLGYSPAPANTKKEQDKQPGPPNEPEPVRDGIQTGDGQHAEDVSTSANENTTPVPETPKAKQTTGWFGFWSSNTPNTSNKAVRENNDNKPAQPAQSTPQKPSDDVVMKDAPPSASPPTQGNQPSAGSTWAFWSRDSSAKPGGKTPATSEQGELAIMGEGSESSPKRSTSVEIGESPAAENKTPSKPAKDTGIRAALSKKSKRARPQSMDLDEASPVRPGTPQSDKSVKNAAIKAPPPPNLLLPSFGSTYRMKENPSIIKQIAQFLLRTHQPPANHVFRVKETPRVRRAIAIGIHGLFPASFLRPMIGQPTGTSIRFMNHCAEAIRRWAESHGCDDIEIEKVALEGEGKIADRVDNLWKLLLNWVDHIRRADLIVVACHSQGVPVGMMLVAKLIELGITNGARIGICAMAGVSLGPFPDYKSSMGMIMGSAAELWQFADPESEVSKRYEQALQAVVNHGARITFVGSIDDQLVPLESALMSPASHPYIYRAVFIDGRIHAPDFISHLVGFALKLRNLGVSDHGLIRELSVPLAGSLYGGEGHSRLYDDQTVYDLAVSHALETTTVSHVPCQVRKHEGLGNPNPYVLPWIMRGLLEEDFVKTELYSETGELLKQFDEWKPITKALKDVKYRLEAVRSKL